MEFEAFDYCQIKKMSGIRRRGMNPVVRYFKKRGGLMILVRMNMTVLPEKRLEMLQSFRSIIGSVKKESGCLSHSVFSHMQKEDSFWHFPGWLETGSSGEGEVSILEPVDLVSNAKAQAAAATGDAGYLRLPFSKK